jgi:pyruvate formate lyase activating enzyme
VALKSELRSVAGLLPVSMVDWEGKLASVVFIKGCNYRCPYCHNPELIRPEGVGHMAWEQVTEQLEAKVGWIDGVVITGGEPTISPDLTTIIERVKETGLSVKLDTNGSHPEVVRELLSKKCLDYVAVDIKGAFDDYDRITRSEGHADAVKDTIEAVTASGIDHEFRTTVVPGFLDSEILIELARYLGERSAKRYILQQFNPKIVLEPALGYIKPYPLAWLEKTAGECAEFVPVNIRGKS